MCNCIALADEFWNKQGYQIDVTLFIDGSPARINYFSVAKNIYNKKLKPKRIVAAYCPMCGKKYPEREKPPRDTPYWDHP